MGKTWPKLIRDPVHDIIPFEDNDCDKLLVELINTSDFQRLRRIKQLTQVNTGIPACSQSNTEIPVCDQRNPGIPAQRNTDIPFCGPAGPIHKTARNLPHWTRQGSVYWITFRLADSLPQEKLNAWRAERETWLNQHPLPLSDNDAKEYGERFDERLQSWLDAGHGSCTLMRPDVRQVVRDCLLRFNGQRLRLHAAVIMPNHVHLLLEPLAGNQLSELLKGIKGASARLANKILGNTGTPFWMDESYDHIVRSQRQYAHFFRYIANNPAKSNLSAGQFWLYQRDTDIPAQCDTDILVCDQSNTDIPVCDQSNTLHNTTDKNVCATPNATPQTGMSVPRNCL